MPRGFENVTGTVRGDLVAVAVHHAAEARRQRVGTSPADAGPAPRQRHGRAVTAGAECDRARARGAVSARPVGVSQAWSDRSLALLQDEVTQAVRPLLLAVLGAVALVLAIAAVNVTNVQLARGAQRRGEFAMRVGAGRRQGVA